jgi:acetyltransferase-like isoleucine patch superfamily enzyme
LALTKTRGPCGAVALFADPRPPGADILWRYNALSLRSLFKNIAFGLALLCVVPGLLSYRLRALVLGRDRALEGSTQALALWPGLLGENLRRAFLSVVLQRCHRSATIGFGTIFSKVGASIAENVVIGPRCHIGLVTIERDVLIAPGCHLPSGARQHGTSETMAAIRDQPGEVTRVTVAEGVWIGSAAVVMANVGAHSIIAAGAVVHDAIPAGVVAGGVPARVLKRRQPT